MPILGLPAVINPQDISTPFSDSRQFGFESLDGQSLIISLTGTELVALWGTQGLDAPPRVVTQEIVPGMDGALIADIKIGARDVFLPIFVGSEQGHLVHLQQRRTLRGLFDFRQNNWRTDGGTFNLVASSIFGERRLRCLYVSGMNGDYTQDSGGSWWQSLGLNLLAVQPYWVGDPWSTPLITRPAATRWFGVFPPQLSSSLAFGSSVPVVVTGDVESWPTISMTGPATSVVISTPAGLYVSIPAGIASGETAVIATDPRATEAAFNGVTDWSRVAPSTAYAPLQPGLSQISLLLAGANTNTTALVTGPSLYEAPW